MYGVRECSNFILLHVAVQFSQYHLLKRLFSPLYILASFIKDKVTKCVWVYLWAFYPVPLIYISVFVPVPYCLDYCSLITVVLVVFGVYPQWVRFVQWVVEASWWRGLVPVFWRMRLDLVSLVAGSRPVVFWGVCELMIFSSLSANGWVCVPVLLVV